MPDSKAAGVAKELEVLFRAKYPILSIVSWEEGRVEETVRGVAEGLRRKFYSWSLTAGFNPPMANVEGTKISPELEALARVYEANEAAVFLLKDFHPYMRDPRVIRLLRDIAGRLRGRSQTLVLMGPTLNLPTELEKDLTVVDFPLPGADEIGELLDRAAGAVRGMPGVDVELTPEEREAIVKSAQGLTRDEVESVFARSLVEKKTFDQGTVLREKQGIIRKSGLLEYYPVSDRMGDVGGMDALKGWLDQRGKNFTDEARAYGLPAPKGVLLLGVQGCGKSLIAKAIAAQWRLPMLKLDVGRIFGSLVGQSEENIRKAIKTAESVAPCVLWADELEKGFAGANSSGVSDGGTTARVFATFLTWMQEKTCYDEATEILTDDGWKPFAQLTGLERVATRDAEGRFEWQRPTRYVQAEHKGRMVRFRSRTTDLLVTPEHLMLAQFSHPGRTEKEFMVPAERIFGKGHAYRVPVRAVWEGTDRSEFVLPEVRHRRGKGEVERPPVPIAMDLWMAFLGIFLAEGWTSTGRLTATSSYYRVGIAQTKPETRREIEAVLNQLPFHWRYEKDAYLINDIRLFHYLRCLGVCHEKHIPREFLELPPARLAVLWEWLLKGDGNVFRVRKNGRLQTTYTTTSAELAGGLQELLLKLGFDGSVQTRPAEAGGTILGRPIVGSRTKYIVTKRTARTRALRGEWEEYDGQVYCVTVPNGVVYTRRNGKPTWSGNSPVFLIATANDVTALPPEMLRKGRFDEIFFVDLPRLEERRQIFRIHLEKRGRDAALFDLDELAALSEGFSGAEIEAAVVASMASAFSDGGREVTMADVAGEVRQAVPLSRTMAEDISALRMWAATRARPAA